MTTQPRLRALNEVIEGYNENMFSFSMKNVDKKSLKYMETVMLHLLASGIEFCSLQTGMFEGSFYLCVYVRVGE